MALKKLAIVGVLSNWLGYLVAAALAFVISPYIVKMLGNEKYGIWSLVMSLTGYYGLLKFGLRGAITKYVSEYNAKNDHEGINKIINTAMVSFTVLGGVVFLVAYVVASHFTEIFKVTYADADLIKMVVIITGIDIATTFVFQVFGTVIAAFKRFDITNAMGISQTTAKYISIFILLKLGFGLIAMAVAVLIINLLTYIFAAIFSYKVYENLKINLKLANLGTFRIIWSYSFFNFMRHVTKVVMENSGTVIAGMFLGMEYVAFYAIADNLMRYGRSFSRGIDNVILPFASEMDATGKKDKIQRMVLTVPKYEFLFAFFLSVIFISMGQELLDLWMGEGYEMSYMVLCILVVPQIFKMSHESLIVMLSGMGHIKYLGIMDGISSICVIILSVSFSQLWGVSGVAMGMLIPLTISYGIIVPVYACRITEIPLFQYIKKTILPPLYSVILPAFFSYYLINNFKPDSLLMLFGEIVLVGVVMLVCSFFLCFDKFIKNIIFDALCRVRQSLHLPKRY